MSRSTRLVWLLVVVGIASASSAAHIGNNFTTFLIGGLVERYGFTPIQMGAFAMVETLAYAAALFLAAARVARLSARTIALVASVMVVLAQAACIHLASFPLLLVTRLAVGFGFGLLNCAVNLAAGRTGQPTRAISAGIALQTLLFTTVNIVLPKIGAQYGIAGMFAALALLSTALAFGSLLLPGERGAVPSQHQPSAVKFNTQGWMILAAMALFTFGSMAIWPFMERTAHAINISAVMFGRYQSVANLMSAVGNLTLTFLASRIKRNFSLSAALLICGTASAILTTTTSVSLFAVALIAYNMSWFITYPLLLGLAFSVDSTGRLAVTASGTWLLFQSFGALAAGVIAQTFGNYHLIGPFGMTACVLAILITWPIARRMDTQGGVLAAAGVH